MSLKAQAKATPPSEDPAVIASSGNPDNPDNPNNPPARPAQENARFETSQIPENFPEKFLKDGKPDFGELIKSYNELGGHLQQKEEDIRARLEADRLAKRPETPDKYEPPKIDGWADDDIAEVTGTPLYKWWSETAHKAGLSQEEFQQSVEQYVASNQPAPVDLEKVKSDLGDNANARIDAVINWMDVTFKDKPDLLDKFDSMLMDAKSIELAEFLMRGGRPVMSDDPGRPAEPEITLESVRAMQQDPRYWDAARRDLAYVKKVEEAYAKLYPQKPKA